MPKLRVVIVDDSPTLLNAVVNVLTEFPDFEIVGLACSALEALDLVAQAAPDVVVTDVSMPEINGLELTHRLSRAPSPPRVVVMTADTHPQYREAAMAAGAVGFVLKDDVGTQLPELLRKLMVSEDR